MGNLQCELWVTFNASYGEPLMRVMGNLQSELLGNLQSELWVTFNVSYWETFNVSYG